VLQPGYGFAKVAAILLRMARNSRITGGGWVVIDHDRHIDRQNAAITVVGIDMIYL
jgi:hypothetical protein